MTISVCAGGQYASWIVRLCLRLEVCPSSCVLYLGVPKVDTPTPGNYMLSNSFFSPDLPINICTSIVMNEDIFAVMTNVPVRGTVRVFRSRPGRYAVKRLRLGYRCIRAAEPISQQLKRKCVCLISVYRLAVEMYFTACFHPAISDQLLRLMVGLTLPIPIRQERYNHFLSEEVEGLFVDYCILKVRTWKWIARPTKSFV